MESKRQFKQPPAPAAKTDQTGFKNSETKTQDSRTENKKSTDKKLQNTNIHNQNKNVQPADASTTKTEISSVQSKKTPVETRMARILPVSAQYFQEIRSQITFNDQTDSEKPQNECQTQLRNQLNDAKVLTSIYNEDPYLVRAATCRNCLR